MQRSDNLTHLHFGARCKTRAEGKRERERERARGPGRYETISLQMKEPLPHPHHRPVPARPPPNSHLQVEDRFAYYSWYFVILTSAQFFFLPCVLSAAAPLHAAGWAGTLIRQSAIDSWEAEFSWGYSCGAFYLTIKANGNSRPFMLFSARLPRNLAAYSERIKPPLGVAAVKIYCNVMWKRKKNVYKYICTSYISCAGCCWLHPDVPLGDHARHHKVAWIGVQPCCCVHNGMMSLQILLTRNSRACWFW